MNEAVVFSQPLDLLVISGSGLKVGVVSQKIPAQKRTPPFKILDPPLVCMYVCMYVCLLAYIRRTSRAN